MTSFRRTARVNKSRPQIIPVGKETAAKWLESYTGTFPFVLSLKSQFKQWGKLSDKQWSAVDKCMVANSTPKGPRVDLVPNCSVDIVLKRFIAKRVSEEKKLKFSPFTYTVKTIKWNTLKAMGVVMSPNFSNVSVCRCCGKALTDWRSLATGVGAVCAKKMGIPYVKTKADVDSFKAQVMQLFLAIGDIETTLPKSQIAEGVSQLEGLVLSAPTVKPVTQVAQKVVQPTVAIAPTNYSAHLLTYDQFTYNDSTKMLSAEMSDLQLWIKGWSKFNPIIVKNNLTGNTVSFTFSSIDVDSGNDIVGWRYKGEFNGLKLGLLLIND